MATDAEICAQLMAVAEAAYVTTVDGEGFPETRAMFNLRRTADYPALSALFRQHTEDLLVYLATNTSSRKVGHMQRDRKASIYYCQPAEVRGLNLVGFLEVVHDQAIKSHLWQEGWERYYPQGPSDPDYAVLRMRPLSARYYHKLQVIELHFAPSNA